MDLGDVTRTCRLCLETCNSGFEVIDEIIQSNLNSLLLYPNLAITDEAIICETCAKNLEHSLEFKAKCVLSEDHINSLMYSGNDLKESHNGTSDYNPQNKCRFCLELDKTDASVLLGIDDVKMLCIYFPELDIKLTEGAIVCTSCHKSLQRHFNFIKNCIKVEEKITDYCRIEITNSKGQIDLNSVANFAFKTMKNEDRLHVVKMEEIYLEEEVKWNLHNEVKGENVCDIKQEVDITVEEATEQDIEPFEYGSSSEVMHTNSPNTDGTALNKCDFCEYQTSRKRYLYRHMAIHKNTMHKCTQCNFQTKHKNSLQRHMLKHKSTSDVPMNKCPFCDFQTKFRPNLNRHLLGHKSSAEVTMYKCTQCSFQIRFKDNMQKHMLVHRNGPDVPTYDCTECTFRTKYKSYLRIHMLTHKSADENTMSKCELCPYQTMNKRNLKKHMTIHESCSQIDMHRCTECRYETKHKHYLREHMIVHKSSSETKMKCCTECSFQTKHQRSLRRHLAIHRVKS